MYFGKQPPEESADEGGFGEERTLRQRHRLIYYLKVWNLTDDRLLGHLIDINTDGLMIVSSQPIEINQEFELEIRWDEPDDQFESIRFIAHSRWAGTDKNPALFNTGFQLISPDSEVTAAIQEVIREYTFS